MFIILSFLAISTLVLFCIGLFTYGIISETKDQKMLKAFGADTKTITDACKRLREIELMDE